MTSPLDSTVLFQIGPVAITQAIVTTWAIILAKAKAAADTVAKAARKENATRAADLSAEIAARLLGRFNTAEV